MKKFNDIITEQFKYSEGFLNALKEVGIGIYEIQDYAWMKQQKLLLDDEKKLKEFRVKLGKYYSKEKFQDDWGDFLDENDDENNSYKDDIIEDKNKIGTIEETDNNVEFSVFLPDTKFRDKNDEKYDLFVAACMTAASAYFKTLKLSLTDVYKLPPINRNNALWEPELLGKFLNYHMTLVDNQNLKKATNGIYRLYKDSKFFYELEELLNKTDYEWLMNEFSKIVK